MTVATKIIMGSGAVAEPDAINIAQSLIFDGTSSYLSKTPGTAGNRRTYTLSCWVKLSVHGATQYIYGGTSTTTTSLRILNTGEVQVFDIVSNSLSWDIKTNRVLRDPSSWYHIVATVDTTQGTAANRVKIYVNGVQETSLASSSYPDQNYQGTINNTVVQYIGKNFSSGSPFYFNGYLAEFNLIDGTQLTPSDFGKTNSDTGQWVAIEYSGSYGTNGFYLKFASGAIGTDSSGNSNTYSATNLANHDVVIDTPTNNFATLNPLPSASSAIVMSQGNLHAVQRAAGITNGQQNVSTIAMPTGSGKWYFEMYQPYSSLGYLFGITPTSENPTLGSSGNLGYNQYNASGGKQYATGSRTDYGTAWYTSGQTYIISCYYDSDNGKIGYYMNGTDQGFAFTDVVAGTYFASYRCGSGGTGSAPTTANFGQNGTFNGAVTAQGNADANGIGDFYYAPPSGYKALCTANLPDPAIPLSSAHFNTLLYTSNNSTLSVTGAGFQPDFIWFKNRTNANRHALFDSVRGVTKRITSNGTDAEVADPDTLTSFDSDGWSIGADTQQYGVNYTAGSSFVSWNWKANGSGSNDTSGDIDATVSANTAAGFSIVTWTSNGSNDGTVPHGLGVVPDVVLYKDRASTQPWYFLTTVIDGSQDYLILNTTAAKADLSSAYGPVTSSVFPNFGFTNSNGIVAYCFVSKPSFSKVGIYTGNGSADGPFISTGFKPAWVMVKRTDTTGEWVIFDNKRSPFNVVDKLLLAENSSAEYTVANTMDINSNGFKMRDTHASRNANNGVYLYMAFAESPFKTANAR